jgi:hypothetical protein
VIKFKRFHQPTQLSEGKVIFENKQQVVKKQSEDRSYLFEKEPTTGGQQVFGHLRSTRDSAKLNMAFCVGNNFPSTCNVALNFPIPIQTPFTEVTGGTVIGSANIV